MGWSCLSSLQSAGYPGSLNLMLLPSDDMASQIIKEGKERDGRGESGSQVSSPDVMRCVNSCFYVPEYSHVVPI